MKIIRPSCTFPLFAKTVLGAAIAFNLGHATAQSTETVEEELVVVGQFQRDLRNAIDLKRNSDTIVDAISADDIDALPALDMGEALQAVPGIQLNREGERRESSVNLRGLPSGFIRTTANGQTIAAPKRGSQNDIFGAASPFGAYDPSIFNGISVIKTQDASMQEGGIAGAVDLRLPKALEKNDGGAVRIGFRSEELADELDTELSASGAIHLIEDVLAISGAIGYSEQNWRRDSLRVNRYNEITDANFAQGSSANASIAEFRAANNLPDDAVIFFPGEIRQASEINSGDRLSFAGNIEYQATEELKLGASIIFTDRQMDDNRLEQLELRSRTFTHVGVTPLGDAKNTGQTNTNSGAPGFVVSRVDLENTRYYYDNRRYNFLQESQALIFDAEWANDEWIIDGAITLSDAENTWDEILISPRAEASSEADASFYSGESNPENWSLDITQFDEAIDFDQPQWEFDAAGREVVINSGAIRTVTPGGGNTGDNQLLLTGTFEVVESGQDSLEANFTRILNEEGLTSVSFGVRSSIEELNSSRVRVSGTDVDPNGIFTNEGKTPTAAQGDFFGGEVAGAADINDGWYSFNFDQVNSALLATIRDDISTIPPRGIEEAVRLPNGYIARGNELGKGFDFDSELDITALYAMADFSFFDMMRGNIGLRYVDTSVDTVAPVYLRTGSTITGRAPDQNVSTSYDHVLPSANLNFDLSEEVILRFAYNETIVRPNLRAVSPQARLTILNDGDGVDITLPGSDVQPFEAQSLDTSIEWYTGDTGIVSLAAYVKKIDGYFVQESTCQPVPGFDIGSVSVNATGECISSGNLDAAGEGDVNPNAIIDQSRWTNSDRSIDVKGFEFSVQQKLEFLPEPWNGFGGTFNFTRVSQSSDRDENGEEILITGVSDKSYNLIGFYEQDSWGLRLSYNWRSDYDIIASNTLFGIGQSTVKAVGRVDLSAYYDITDALKISLKGYNLSESIYEEYQNIEDQIRRSDFEGRTWVISASYKF